MQPSGRRVARLRPSAAPAPPGLRPTPTRGLHCPRQIRRGARRPSREPRQSLNQPQFPTCEYIVGRRRRFTRHFVKSPPQGAVSTPWNDRRAHGRYVALSSWSDVPRNEDPGDLRDKGAAASLRDATRDSTPNSAPASTLGSPVWTRRQSARFAPSSLDGRGAARRCPDRAIKGWSNVTWVARRTQNCSRRLALWYG